MECCLPAVQYVQVRNKPSVRIEAARQKVHALVLVPAVALEGDGGGDAGLPSTGEPTSKMLTIDAEVPKSK